MLTDLAMDLGFWLENIVGRTPDASNAYIGNDVIILIAK